MIVIGKGMVRLPTTEPIIYEGRTVQDCTDMNDLMYFEASIDNPVWGMKVKRVFDISISSSNETSNWVHYVVALEVE